MWIIFCRVIAILCLPFGRRQATVSSIHAGSWSTSRKISAAQLFGPFGAARRGPFVQLMSFLRLLLVRYVEDCIFFFFFCV
jgi:hypothetical protein